MSIILEHISKYFDNKIVLKDLNLTIEDGTVYSLIGKNGAGKTTLINILTDFIYPNFGEVKINGLSYDKHASQIKKNIGLLSEGNSLIEDLTGEEYLNLIGRIYNLSKKELSFRINSLLNFFFDENNIKNKLISKYSTGMKKKIEFCSAVLHKPNILILDEPFSGLDPFAANKLIEFLKKYQNKQRIIFISSHNLDYVAKVATHIGILHNHTLIFNGKSSDFSKNGNDDLNKVFLEYINGSKIDLEVMDWAF